MGFGILIKVLPLLGLSWLLCNNPASAQALAGDTLIKILQRDTVTNHVITINRVLIIGNKVTYDRIISRELSLKPGDTISTKRIEKVLTGDQRKIYNLRLFNTVSIRWLLLSANQVDLLIEVSERWYTFPIPIFELSDRNFNEWWQNYKHDFSRINYGLRLYQYNFRGRNETLRLTGQFGYTRRFELSYRIPYIDRKQRHGLIFDINYNEPKNLAYFTEDHKLKFLEGDKTLRIGKGASVTYTFRRSFYETHSFNFTYLNNQVADTVVALNPNYYGDAKTRQQFGSIAYLFNSEHRDVVAFPLKGYQITGSIQRSGVIWGKDVNQWELNLTYSKYFSLGKEFYLSNFTSGYVSKPGKQPYTFFSALGYRRQFVKGYEIYVVEGPAFFLNKTTFRKKIFSRTWQFEDMPLEQFKHFPLTIYLKSYVDMGYVENYPYYTDFLPEAINSRLSNKLLVGAGTGLDFVMAYDAVLRFEYTFTREKTQGFFFHMKKEF